MSEKHAKEDSGKKSSSKPVSQPKTSPREKDELPLEDLDQVSGGVYTPGGPRLPVPPPSHRAE